MDGHEKRIYPVAISLDGWYFGNILLGGFLGMVIIDPATGAMWELDTEYVFESFEKETAALNISGGEGKSLKIIDYNTLSDEMKSKLKPVE